MDKAKLEKILDAANQAPSGGNSQSWRFEVRGDMVKVVMLPEKDHEVLNVANRGTMLAHGALLENIMFAARAVGYTATFKVLPEKNTSALVTFTPSEAAASQEENELAAVIPTRHTNRKPYATESISADDVAYLFKEAGRFSSCQLSTIVGAGISKIAEASANDIRLYLGNQRLHHLLFKEVLWNESEQHERGGLYYKTMEAVPPKSVVFKFMRHWRVARFLGGLGLHQKIYEESVKTLSASALLGAISVSGSDADYIEAGRFLQNIWLRATNRGLSLQLITGVVYLSQKLLSGGESIFNETEAGLIRGAYAELENAYNTKNRTIALTFRIGKAPPPLAVSYKRPPRIDWK